MNTSSLQNPEEDRALDSQGLASVTFTLQWSDDRAEHEEEMHVEKFSVWREADFLPAAIRSGLSECTPGIPQRHSFLPER